MFSFRDLILFLAGAEFFHTLSHIFIIYYIPLPIHMKFFTFTSHMNTWAIVANAIITIVLLWWSTRLSR